MGVEPDGFLNNNFYFNVDLSTITICMDVRIAEIMKDHLPDEMTKEAEFFPKMPNHPDMMKLQLGLAALSPALAKSSHRLGCQRMYMAVQTYYPAQFAIFYTARFSSGPCVLYRECLLYALCHIYTPRHMGLTLGGRGNGELAASGSMRLSTTDVDARSDAGHAQAGPSTGGYSIELGSTTMHVVSGAHHTTTLGATNVRGVACGSDDGRVPVLHDRA